MKLYQSSYLAAFAARCRIQIYAKQLTEIEIVPPPGGLSSEEYKKINPSGKVPALVVDGQVIAESEVICEYIEDRYPTPALRPAGALERAQVRVLSRVQDLYVVPPLVALYKQAKLTERDTALIQQNFTTLRNHLGLLEGYLTRYGYVDGCYAIGDNLTLADCAMTPILLTVVDVVMRAFNEARSMEQLPALSRYWQNIQRDKHCARVIAEMTEVRRARMESWLQPPATSVAAT